MDIKEIKNFWNLFDTILLICDEMLKDSSNEEVVSQCYRVSELLMSHKRKVLYAVDDCIHSRQELSDYFKKRNLHIPYGEIVCTTSLFASYLKKKLDDRKAYIVGSSGIAEELQIAGVNYFGPGPEVLYTSLPEFLKNFKVEKDVAAVVVGFDEHLSYLKMTRVATYLTNPEVAFVAPSSDHLAKPFLTWSECCTDRKAFIFDNDATVFGETISNIYDVVPERTLVIATREQPEVFAKWSYFKTLLVSNIQSSRDAEDRSTWSISKSAKIAPDFCCNTLAEMLPTLGAIPAT